MLVLACPVLAMEAGKQFYHTDREGDKRITSCRPTQSRHSSRNRKDGDDGEEDFREDDANVCAAAAAASVSSDAAARTVAGISTLCLARVRALSQCSWVSPTLELVLWGERERGGR